MNIVSTVLLLLIAATSLLSQVAVPTSCAYREGDDPAWSRPDYDDSQWSTRPPASTNLALSELPISRTLWLRCRVDLQPLNSVAQLDLQVRSPSAWIAFFDGAKVGGEGNPRNGSIGNSMPSIPLPGSAASPGGPHLVALRVTRNTMASPASSPIAIGSPAALRLRRDDAIETAISPIWFASAMAPVLLAVGLLFLVLSGADPNRREVFWFALLTISLAILRIRNAMQALQFPIPWLDGPSQFIGELTYCVAPWFFYSLRGKRVPKLYRVLAPAAAALAAVPNGLIRWLPGDATFRLYALSYSTTSAHALVVTLLILLWTSALAAFWPYWKMRGEAWITFLAVMLWMAAQVAVLAVQLPVIGTRLGIAPSFLRELQTLAVLPAILILTVTLALRLRRIRSEHDNLSTEMRAARAVQQRLVPESTPSIPGFHIDTAYLPAKEVGGDFYRFLPAEDGSLLVVVGDVSGKGLDAAMIVAAVIGALGHPPSRHPREVLAHLNESILGQTGGGFVTCCAALFHPGGRVEIANAGHIPPYLQGREILVDPAPPLGMFPEFACESTTIETTTFETTTIKTRATLTFLSDGVVEARNPQGELYGFDRLAALTTKPANEIAETALAWGQDDDITVVQVRMNA